MTAKRNETERALVFILKLGTASKFELDDRSFLVGVSIGSKYETVVWTKGFLVVLGYKVDINQLFAMLHVSSVIIPSHINV